jgi:O-antigen/teichoic acid export membrane protein
MSSLGLHIDWAKRNVGCVFWSAAEQVSNMAIPRLVLFPIAAYFIGKKEFGIFMAVLSLTLIKLLERSLKMVWRNCDTLVPQTDLAILLISAFLLIPTWKTVGAVRAIVFSSSITALLWTLFTWRLYAK